MRKLLKNARFTKHQQIGVLILLAQIGIAPLVYKAGCDFVLWITQ